MEDQRVGQILALLAHDLRSPLMALEANLAYLLTETPTPDEADVLADCRASCAVFQSVTDNMAYLGRHFAEGQAPLNSLCLGRLAREIWESMTSLADSYGIELDSTSRFEPCAAELDELSLRVALRNLLCGAVQHAGGQGKVQFEFLPQGERAIFRVRDSGSAPLGEPNLTLEEQLRRPRSSPERRYRGIGQYVLKLAAMRLGAELHFGRAALGYEVVLSVPTSI